ncbi:DUF6701 domain-containing protein [Paraglaciecola sp. L1A13]|uniref:DUF6701 domain-containing protein n=1 Tax=Paraglaciecola sp. L1A13 TaxID=2686359 RepID=UPI00131AABD4|nr:DUF6701 domain-containing protein [Paraglaciecola sp. L1A13]
MRKFGYFFFAIIALLLSFSSWARIDSCSSETYTVADNFPSASYNSTSGTAPWTSNWLEAGESDGPSSGILRVNDSLCTSASCMRLGIVASSTPQSYSAHFLYRTLDLSDAVSAQLTFNYRTGHNAGSSNVRLGISRDGGRTWANLEQYTVTTSQFSATAESFDISSFIGSNVAIGFEVRGTNSRSGFYVDDLVVTATKAEVCDGSAIAFYQFEQTEWSEPSSIIDSSSSGFNGSPIGDVFPQFPSSQTSCQVLVAPSNSSASIIDALDTQLRVDTDIGYRGTISFWYRSTQSWQSNTGRILFDASTWIGNANSKYFRMSLRSGTLDFGLEDSADADAVFGAAGLDFAANEWVHVAVTYNYQNDSAAIYINGAIAAQTTNLGFNGQIPVLDTLYIGDNRSLYESTNSSGSSASGEFDDLRIYDYGQTLAQINTDLSNLSPCDVLPYAVYELEQVEYDGNRSIIDSSDNLRHGSPVGDISSILSVEQISCRFVDIPLNSSAATFDAIDTGFSPDDIGTAGTISFWYRSNEDWSSTIGRQLFDASTDVGSTNSKYFYLSLSASTLYFGLEDSNDTDAEVVAGELDFAANEWVHIAVSYDYAAKTAVIFVNGNEAGRSNSLNLNSNIAQFQTLYIGDNRSSYIVTNMSGNSANGQFDNIRLYAYVQNSSQVSTDMNLLSTCQAISHFQLEHDGQGLTCDAESITIKACADDGCSQLYTDVSSLTLTPQGWESGNPLVFNGSLSATQLRVLEPSSFTFTRNASYPDVPLRCINTGSGEQSCDMTFVDAGFEFIGSQTTDKFLPDQLSQVNFSAANLRAVQNDEGVCKALLQGEQDITLGVTCTSPNVCLTSFGPVDTSVNPEGESTGNISLTFDADGIASLSSLNYADAGRVMLRAEAQISGVTVTSGEASVDVVPSSLVLLVAPESLLYTDGDFSIYPSTIDRDSYPAGEEFTFNITAYGAIGDTPLLNYQPGELQIAIERMLPFETAGADGSLTYGESGEIILSIQSNLTKQFSSTATLIFADGQYSYQANYSEVGVIRVDVRDADYLTDNNNPTSIISSGGTLTLGEFRPAYFDVNVLTPPELTNQCDNFSYMGQDIEFSPATQVELLAMSALGSVTKNYANGYWRYDPDLLNGVLIEDASIYGSTTPAVTRVTYETTAVITEPVNFDGITLIELPDARFKYQKVDASFAAYALLEPFAATIDIRLLDTFLSADNNVCYQSDYPVSGCEEFRLNDISGPDVIVRHGRLALEPNFGPETDFLVVPVKAEHYLNGRWQFNPEDSCTAIDLTESAGQIILTPEGSIDITADIDSVSSSGDLVNGVSIGSFNFALLGNASNNGPGAAGVVKVSLDPSENTPAWAEYMNFDWNSDGYICANSSQCSSESVELDEPSSLITFGIFRGNDRIIHWREVFN